MFSVFALFNERFETRPIDRRTGRTRIQKPAQFICKRQSAYGIGNSAFDLLAFADERSKLKPSLHGIDRWRKIHWIEAPNVRIVFEVAQRMNCRQERRTA